MTSYKGFHSQLTSIMEALTKAAVAEICELVDDSYAVLRLEIARSQKENEALRRKLELIESIIARGHRGSAAVLGVEEGGAALLDFAAGEFSGSLTDSRSVIRRSVTPLIEQKLPLINKCLSLRDVRMIFIYLYEPN